jgi:hypothetical protein
VLLQANGDSIVGRQRERQGIEYCLVTPNVDFAVQLDRHITAIMVRLQWRTIGISTWSYRRPRDVPFLDVHEGPVPRFLGLSKCARNRHGADRCKNTVAETDFHSSSPCITD